jgi:hypothetical protein
MIKGQTISWYVQDTSEIWKPAEGQKTGEEPVKISLQSERGEGSVDSTESLLLINNLGIQCHILSIKK